MRDVQEEKKKKTKKKKRNNDDEKNGCNPYSRWGSTGTDPFPNSNINTDEESYRHFQSKATLIVKVALAKTRNEINIIEIVANETGLAPIDSPHLQTN